MLGKSLVLQRIQLGIPPSMHRRQTVDLTKRLARACAPPKTHQGHFDVDVLQQVSELRSVFAAAAAGAEEEGGLNHVGHMLESGRDE